MGWTDMFTKSYVDLWGNMREAELNDSATVGFSVCVCVSVLNTVSLHVLYLFAVCLCV